MRFFVAFCSFGATCRAAAGLLFMLRQIWNGWFTLARDVFLQIQSVMKTHAFSHAGASWHPSLPCGSASCMRDRHDDTWEFGRDFS